MKPPVFHYSRPQSLAEAFAALAEDGATPIAGGQSLLPMLNLRLAGPSRLVDLGRIASLRESGTTGNNVTFGAATTHAAIEDGRAPDASHGMMAAVAREIAYRAVRNFGTLGGAVALADPAADWPACFLALDAQIRVAGASGEHRVPIDDFLRGPYETALAAGELIVAFDIPQLPRGARWGWQKLARKKGAYAESLGAAVFRPEGPPRIVLGANQNRAVLLADVARQLAERPGVAVSELRPVIAAGVRAAAPQSDPYQLRCHAAMIERAITQARAT